MPHTVTPSPHVTSHAFENARSPLTPVLLPPDREVQPISEGQLAALVRGLRGQETDKGVLFAREGYPWHIVREGDRVVVRHHSDPPSEQHYIVV